MRQMVSWKHGVFTILGGLLLLANPVWSQDTNSTTSTPPATDAKSYVGFGIANGAKGDLDGAIAAFNQALTIDSKYAPAYFNRGLAYSLQNKEDAAIADYNKAIELDPNYKQAYYQRGSLQGRRGNLDAAISDFSKTVELDPKYAPAYYNRGHVQYFKGDLDGANQQISQALTLDPNFSYSYFIRGLIRHAQGHRDDAMADFQKSSGLNFPYAAYWVWITEMEGGQHGLARKDLSDALNKPDTFKPDDWPSQIGNFLLEKITQDQLMAKTKGANDSETSDRLCEAWFYAGMAKRFAGDSKGAQDCFNAAIATGQKGSEEYIEAARQLSASATP